MHNTLVSAWFGPSFKELHPLLQQLHTHGGVLSGTVEIKIPHGFTGVIGRKLAKILSIPFHGVEHDLVVSISHHADGLHWDRCFDNRISMHSVFQPVGRLPEGHWVESTGPIKLFLTVDTLNGGWYWRTLKITVRGITLPVWLFPKSKAYKTIEDGKYRFYVGFSLPLLGTVLSYSGLLAPSVAARQTNE